MAAVDGMLMVNKVFLKEEELLCLTAFVKNQGV